MDHDVTEDIVISGGSRKQVEENFGANNPQ